MKYTKKWEYIDQNDSDRLCVPGGWIVRSWIDGYDKCTLHQIFVSDPEHKWVFDGDTTNDEEL